jgi:hypothetical protein
MQPVRPHADMFSISTSQDSIIRFPLGKGVVFFCVFSVDKNLTSISALKKPTQLMSGEMVYDRKKQSHADHHEPCSSIIDVISKLLEGCG